MYEKIYDALVDAKIKPYSIGQHNGECDSPYVVISNAGTNPFSIGLKYDIIDIIIYYPIGAYSKVEPYANKVKQVLKKIKNFEQENADLLLDSALKDSKIEQLENDLSDLMLEIATIGGN